MNTYTPDQDLDVTYQPKDEEPKPPLGYTAEELERDNPYNQWMYEE